MKKIFNKLWVNLILLVFSDAVPLKLIPGERNVIKEKGVTHTISRFYIVPSDFGKETTVKALRLDDGSSESKDSVTEDLLASVEDEGTSTVAYNDTSKDDASSTSKVRTTATFLAKSNVINDTLDISDLSESGSLLVKPVSEILSTNNNVSWNASDAREETIKIRREDTTIDNEMDNDTNNRVASNNYELDDDADNKISEENVDVKNSSNFVTKQVVDDSKNKADAVLLATTLTDDNDSETNKEVLSDSDLYILRSDNENVAPSVYALDDPIPANENISRSIQYPNLVGLLLNNPDSTDLATKDGDINNLRSRIDEEYTDPWSIVSKLSNDIVWTEEDIINNDIQGNIKGRVETKIPWYTEDKTDNDAALAVDKKVKSNLPWHIEDKKHNDVSWAVDERVKNDLPWLNEDKKYNDVSWAVHERVKSDIPGHIDDTTVNDAALAVDKRVTNDIPWQIEDNTDNDVPWVIDEKGKTDIPWHIKDKADNSGLWTLEDRNKNDIISSIEDKIKKDILSTLEGEAKTNLPWTIKDKKNNYTPWTIEDKLNGDTNYIVKKKMYKIIPWTSDGKVVGTGPTSLSKSGAVNQNPATSAQHDYTNKQPYHVFTYVVRPSSVGLLPVSHELSDLDNILNMESTQHTTKLEPSIKHFYKLSTIQKPTSTIHVNKPSNYELQHNIGVTTYAQNQNASPDIVVPATLHEHSYNIKNDVVTPKIPQDESHNIYSDVVLQNPNDYSPLPIIDYDTVDPKISHAYTYNLDTNVETPKPLHDYSLNVNSGAVDPKITHTYSYSIANGTVTPKTPLDESDTIFSDDISQNPQDYTLSVNSGSSNPKLSHEYGYKVKSQVLTQESPQDAIHNTYSSVIPHNLQDFYFDLNPDIVNPKITHEYSYNVKPNVVTPKIPQDYSLNTYSDAINPKITHEYSYNVKPKVVTPKIPQDYSINTYSDAINPKITHEYSYNVKPNVVTPKIPQDYSLNTYSDAINPKITHEYSYSIDKDVVTPVTSQDHSYSVHSGSVVPEIIQDYTLNVETDRFSPKVTHDYSHTIDSDIVNPYTPQTFNVDSSGVVPNTQQDYNININSGKIPKISVDYNNVKINDIHNNLAKDPLNIPLKDSENDRSLDIKPDLNPTILFPTDLTSSNLPKKQLLQGNPHYYKLNIEAANQHPKRDKNYIYKNVINRPADVSYTYNHQLVRPDNSDDYQSSNLKLAPTYKLFTLLRLLTLADGLKRQVLSTGLNPQENNALKNLLKILQILLIQADYFGQRNDWYEKIFQVVPPQNQHPLQLYAYHLIRQRWLHDLLLLLHKNNFDLNIFRNPKLISLLESWQFPQYVLNYLEAEHAPGKNYLLHHNTINAVNPSYHHVGDNKVCQHCPADLESFVTTDILYNYPYNEGLILNIAGKNIEPDANAVKVILQKYLLNKNAIEDQENVIMQDNTFEMLKHIILYLKQKGYRTQIITDLINKLNSVMLPTLKRCVAQKANVPQNIYDIILPTLRRSQEQNNYL